MAEIRVSSTRTPRTGRRPGRGSTRARIRDSAGRLFAEHGYAGASIRAIAADAGVDAALVVHFFGTKSALLGEAVRWPFDPTDEIPKLLSTGRRHVGKQVVSLFVRIWDEEGTRNPILTLLGAATTQPEAAAMLREFLRERLLAPLTEALGVDQPAVRANLVASQLAGLGFARYILSFEPLASSSQDEVIAWIAPTVQRYLTGTIAHERAFRDTA